MLINKNSKVLVSAVGYLVVIFLIHSAWCQRFEVGALLTSTRICFNSLSSSFQSECVYCDRRLYPSTIFTCTEQLNLPANITQAQAFCIATACIQVSKQDEIARALDASLSAYQEKLPTTNASNDQQALLPTEAPKLSIVTTTTTTPPPIQTPVLDIEQQITEPTNRIQNVASLYKKPNINLNSLMVKLQAFKWQHQYLKQKFHDGLMSKLRRFRFAINSQLPELISRHKFVHFNEQTLPRNLHDIIQS